ncbi:hypothetical protein BU15DRAFT_73901 [Melanogaster broomeanus]|nr:hypothetical protein BU15DRAFT_73901 [Melanogaster broomeanus]
MTEFESVFSVLDSVTSKPFDTSSSLRKDTLPVMHALKLFRDRSSSPMIAPQPVPADRPASIPKPTVLSPGPLVSKETWKHETEISTALIKGNGVPLPLIWIMVKDNVIPPHAVPFSKDHRGDLYIARALVEGELYLGCAAHHLKNGAIELVIGGVLTR